MQDEHCQDFAVPVPRSSSSSSPASSSSAISRVASIQAHGTTDAGPPTSCQTPDDFKSHPSTHYPSHVPAILLQLTQLSQLRSRGTSPIIMVEPPQNLFHLLEFSLRLLNGLLTVQQALLIIRFISIARLVLIGAKMLYLFAGVLDLR